MLSKRLHAPSGVWLFGSYTTVITPTATKFRRRSWENTADRARSPELGQHLGQRRPGVARAAVSAGPGPARARRPSRLDEARGGGAISSSHTGVWSKVPGHHAGTSSLWETYKTGTLILDLCGTLILAHARFTIWVQRSPYRALYAYVQLIIILSVDHHRGNDHAGVVHKTDHEWLHRLQLYHPLGLTSCAHRSRARPAAGGSASAATPAPPEGSPPRRRALALALALAMPRGHFFQTFMPTLFVLYG